MKYRFGGKLFLKDIFIQGFNGQGGNIHTLRWLSTYFTVSLSSAHPPFPTVLPPLFPKLFCFLLLLLPLPTSRSSFNTYIGAYKHLCKRVCPSVRQSIHPSVRLSVGPSDTPFQKRGASTHLLRAALVWGILAICWWIWNCFFFLSI